MALPGVVDPLTGTSTSNPLDPTNPASGQRAVPPQIDLSQGVGLTGADGYNMMRLTRAQAYLSGASPNYADLSGAVALAPTDWTTLDQHIQALGGQVGYGSGVGQLTEHLMSHGAPRVPVADIATLQQNLVKQGFMPPGSKISGVWDSDWAAGMKAADDYNYNKAQSGQKAGGASALQFLSWLGDVMPSKVSQALAGTAKFLFGGIAHTVTRQAIEAAHAPGTYLASVLPFIPGVQEAPSKSLAENPEVQAALQQHGLAGGAKGSIEDLSTVLALLPLLKGAGVLADVPMAAASWGVKGAAATAGGTALETATQQGGISVARALGAAQGWTTPVEGATAKGLVSSSVRTLVNKAALADSPLAVGDLLNSYASRTFSLRALGEGFLNTADQLAAYKGSAAGQVVTAGLNALTQTSIGERAVANVTAGTILPNIHLGPVPLSPGLKLGKEERSALGAAIDNTPALGQSWRIPGLEALGNPVDLSAFIWAPTKALPIGGRPTIGDMANSLDRITPTSVLMPLIRSTGLNRQQLVDSFGSEAGLKQAMRYFGLQAAVSRDATLWADAKGLKPGADGWAEAVRGKVQEISTALKADPLKMEQAISSASPIDILHQFQYMFGDQPQVLARRGQGQAVLQNWSDATTAIKDVIAGPDLAVIDSLKAQARADVEAQGPAATLQAVPQADYYHGTAKPFAGDQLDPDRYMAGSGANNLFGPGVYVTDHPGVALSYTDKGIINAERAGIANKTVYGIKWSGQGTPNLLDLQQPVPGDARQVFSDFFASIPGNEYAGEDLAQLQRDLATKPGFEIYRELRQALSDAGLPKYEADEHLDDLATSLEAKGYDGLSYQGGAATGSTIAHRASVFFDSSKLAVTDTTRTAEVKAAQVEQRTKDLLAQNNGGAVATVDTFTRGQGVWTSANQDALNSALEPFMQGRNIGPLRDAEGNLITPVRAGGGGVPGSSYAFGEQMAGRLGEALDPDATIALRRADNALGSAQQLASWKIVWDRLGSVARSLETRLSEVEMAGSVEAPKLLQVSDLQAAGMADKVVRDPRLLGLTGAQIPAQAATDLLSHVASRLEELKGTMNKYYEETAKMDPGELSSYSGKLTQQAARDVTLSDSTLMQDLASLGYQPVALHPGAITLNHVGAGTADGLANAADVAPLKDFLGINKIRPDELSFMRTQATRNELGNLARTMPGIGQSGRELMGRVYDTARAASEAGRDIPFTNLQMERHVMDLRQLSVKDFQQYGGFSPAEAWQVYGAVRRGAAFGFDISRPIATARNLVDAMAYNGLPGIEDAIRTLVSLKPDTGVKWVDGPAGHILNLPDTLARARDFVQFGMSPMFYAAKAFKTKVLRGVESLPFDFRPADRIVELASESGNADEFLARFNENYRRVMGESRGHAYATLLDNPDFGIKNPGSGVFGHTNEHGIALDAWHLAQQARQEKGIFGDAALPSSTYQAIKDKVNGIYGYGPRSGLEKTGNYVFFPLSFDIKVGKALGGWALQNPARILAISLGLQAYNQANQNNAIGGFFDKYLPVLQELNKLNFFAGGFHTQLTPIGGRNTTLWNLGKDMNALIQQDPRLGAYVPISVSDNDLPSMLGMFSNLLPMWRQMQTGEKALTSQMHAVTEGSADQYQVDNYYQSMGDLKRQVAISLGNAGMKPSFSTLTDTYGNMNSKVSPEFFNQVQAAIGQVEARYPAGAAFAKAQSADYQHRADALNELMRKPVKSRAEASMLYFAAAYYDLQAQAQSSARANASVGRAGRALYQQIAGAMAQGTTPPTLPGDLDATQVAQLRRLALGLEQDAGPEFTRRYNLLFRSELGPLSAYEQAPGVTGPGQPVAGVA